MKSFKLLILIGCALLVSAVSAMAQVKRNFTNLGFEQPNLPSTNCWVAIPDASVPGWRTTHPSASVVNNCGLTGLPTTGPLIELWNTPFNGVTAPQGKQLAELNANVASRLYQDVCLINGESVSWNLSHRGRGSATVYDVANFALSTDSVTFSNVVQVSTTNAGTYLPPVVGQGTVNPPVNVAGNPTWVTYSGQFNYAGATGLVYMGFGAVSTAAGNISVGNLLDNIQIEVAPLVEFTASSSSTTENTSSNLPQLRISGTLYNPVTVVVKIVGGTAVLGSDYTTTSGTDTINITIPTGNYDGTASTGSLFTIPVTIIDDPLAESSENIQFQIQPSPGPIPKYGLYSSQVCGAPAQATWDYTIIDNDQGLVIIKNAGTPVQVSTNTAQYDVIYTLQVSNPSTLALTYNLTDAPDFDVDAVINSAAFTLNGSPGAVLTGSGPWTLATNRNIAIGATDTFLLTIRYTIVRPGTVSNDSCVNPSVANNGLHNSASLLQQAAGANPARNLSATACTDTKTPVWIRLNKNLVRRALPSDQIEIRILLDSASILTPLATALTSGASTTASTGVISRPAGEILKLNESIKTNGTGADTAATIYRPNITCTNAGTAFTGLPSGLATNLGTNSAWTEFLPAAGADIDCTITNNPIIADLQISKINNVNTVSAGSTTTYTIVVSNNGPDSITNTIVKDPISAGLSCTTASCSASGGSTCPGATGAALVNALQSGSGATVPLLTNGGSVSILLTCTVTATGF